MLFVEDSNAACTNFKVIMDKKVFLSSEDYFVVLAVFFVLFFVFNIEYAKNAAATMEFIPR